MARTILNQQAMAPFSAGDLSPGPTVHTDREVLDWVAREADTAVHPSCTARMGIDERSVVDSTSMTVHGIQGLRVVDASVLPHVTSSYIHAPVVMVAEKSADLILGNSPLPSEPTATPAGSCRSHRLNDGRRR